MALLLPLGGQPRPVAHSTRGRLSEYGAPGKGRPLGGKWDIIHHMAKHQGQARTGRDGSLDIIFEDADIVVVIKPLGIPVINPDGGRGRNLLDMVSTHIQRRHPRARAALVHRLDRDTSGVMVFATNARAKKTLMDEWQERAKDRRYVALVEGDMGAESGILDSWIAPAGRACGSRTSWPCAG